MKSRRRIAFSKAQDHANSVANYSKDCRRPTWGIIPLPGIATGKVGRHEIEVSESHYGT
jgi:hypothetical protein